MYRDLSAQLAAKEIELTEARETMAKLEARVRDLENQVREVSGGMANRDAVLKGAMTDNDGLRKERDELREKVAELAEKLHAAQRRRYSTTSVIEDVVGAVRDAFKK